MPPIRISPTRPVDWTGGGQANSQPDGQSQSDGQSPQAVTSHSITWNTSLFSIGYTWQKVDQAAVSEPEERAVAPCAPAEKPAQQRVRRRSGASDTAEEARRRLQLAQLLSSDGPTAEAPPAESAPSRSSWPNPRSVCRSYNQGNGLGPAASDRDLPSC